MNLPNKYPIFSLVIITLLVCIITLYLRINEPITFFNNTLWAEDGSIFINDAFQHGLNSLFLPYAGYLHLYPRLFALVVDFIGLKYAPLIFFLGWTAAFLFTSMLIVKKLTSYKIGLIPTLIIIILICLQPSHGETFFTITNAQWFLGLALSIILLMNRNGLNKTELFILPLLCLTGPFSILIILPLLLKAYIYHDFYKNKTVYIIVGFCAVVQLLFVLYSSARTESLILIDTNLIHWLKAAWMFLSFGSNSVTVSILSLCFWGILLFVSIYTYVKKSSSELSEDIKINKQIAYLLLFSAAVLFITSVLISGREPHKLGPLLLGARYFVIPYSLLFIAITLLTYNYHRIILLTLLFAICLFQFMPFERSEYYFDAYTAFAQQKNDVIMPINPLRKRYPSWHINSDFIDNEGNHFSQPKQYDLKLIGLAGAAIQHVIIPEYGQVNIEGSKTETKMALQIKAFDRPFIRLKEKVSCQNSKYIGIELNIWKDRPGLIRMLASSLESVYDKKPITRYYPKGNIVAQFAFPYPKDGIYLGFNPLKNTGVLILKKIELFCLADEKK